MRCLSTVLVLVLAFALAPPSHAVTLVFNVPLDATQEEPPPTGAEGASGQATVTVDTETGDVSVEGTYSGLSTPANAAHIHGLAEPGMTVGVIVPLEVSGGTEGIVSGSGTLPADQLEGLMGGLTYLNVHTDMNPPGEIRGQIVNDDVGVVVFDVTLDAGQEEPPPAGAEGASGQATVTLDTTTRTVTVDGSYENMSSEVSAAHIHGLAPRGVSVGVIVPLETTGGTAGTLSGGGELSPGLVQGMLDGLTYLNVHTDMNPPGEIRGQLELGPDGVPVPVAGWLGMIALVAGLAGAATLGMRRRAAAGTAA